MGRRRRIKTVPDAGRDLISQSPVGRDLISQLPAEVKDRILECLDTRSAARTALLSTHWNDVWLQHGRLVLDWKFLARVEERIHDEEDGRTIVNIINNILLSRVGPVKKFILEIDDDNHKPHQSDFDSWCRFLTRNGVEELTICLYSDYLEPEYELPFCILLSRTIKHLEVQGPLIHLPLNGGSIFSNVTSLAFLQVEFKRNVNGIASSFSIPKLEKLAFDHCGWINIFQISAPKLEILSVVNSMVDVVDSRWLTPHFRAIKTLWLSGSSLSCIEVSMIPTAINLQVLKLFQLSFSCGKQLTIAMQLLQKSPNLCELGVMGEEELIWSDDDKEAASRLLEDPDNGFSIPDMKMLNKIKIESFSESTLEILFVKMLLSKSPALERVVVVKSWNMDASKVTKFLRKLSCFPRASPEAQIVCMGNRYASMRKDWLDIHGFDLLQI